MQFVLFGAFFYSVIFLFCNFFIYNCSRILWSDPVIFIFWFKTQLVTFNLANKAQLLFLVNMCEVRRAQEKVERQVIFSFVESSPNIPSIYNRE